MIGGADRQRFRVIAIKEIPKAPSIETYFIYRYRLTTYPSVLHHRRDEKVFFYNTVLLWLFAKSTAVVDIGSKL